MKQNGSNRAYVKGEITREELQFTNEKQEEEVKNLEKKLLQAAEKGKEAVCKCSFIRKGKVCINTGTYPYADFEDYSHTGEVYGDKVSFWAYKGRIYGCISVSEKNQME